jgi:hypothetical protein
MDGRIERLYTEPESLILRRLDENDSNGNLLSIRFMEVRGRQLQGKVQLIFIEVMNIY